MNSLSAIWSGVQGRYWVRASKYFACRMRNMPSRTPYISFTFDDFPRSALKVGGEVLARYGVRGTYYVSLGLMGTEAPSGLLCTQEDVMAVLREHHELGCHTYSHCHSFKTRPVVFEDAIVMNQRMLADFAPEATFQSLAYPIAGPRVSVKKRACKYFRCCRGGGQTMNVGKIDMNLLSAFFLEKCKGNMDPVRRIINQTCVRKGWLIFATHDISSHPTPYGCTPSFFEEVVRCSTESGASVLPVGRALDAIENDLR